MKIELKTSPVVHVNRSTRSIMTDVIIALMPFVIFNAIKNGTQAVLVMFVAALTAVLTELIYFYFSKAKKDWKVAFKQVKFSYPLIPGLILGLFIPTQTPLSIVALSSFFGVFVGKQLFGGFGYNIFNPALVGMVFFYGAYLGYVNEISLFSNAYLNVDTVAMATPLQKVAELGQFITPEQITSNFGSLTNMFFGMHQGSGAEGAAFLSIIALIYLTVRKAFDVRIPIVYVGTVFVMSSLVALLTGMTWQYPIYQVLSGGLLFGAVFMATEPVTSPTTANGKIIYAFFLGVITYAIRTLGNYPEGVLTAILMMNMFTPLIDSKTAPIIEQAKIEKMNKIFNQFFGTEASTYENVTSNFDGELVAPVVSVYEAKNGNNEVVGVVFQTNPKGYGGEIEMLVAVNNAGDVKGVDYLSMKETPGFGTKWKEEPYFSMFNGQNIETLEVDYIAGATISSKAIEAGLKSAKEQFNKIK